MPAIKVTSEQLQSVSSQLASGSQEVSQQLDTMRARVQGLVDADWNGAASDSFHELYTKWNTGAMQVKEALDGISQMLAKAGQTYQQTEDQLAQQLRG